MRVAIYARVSTFDLEPQNQLAELRQYVTDSLAFRSGLSQHPRRQDVRSVAGVAAGVHDHFRVGNGVQPFVAATGRVVHPRGHADLGPHR
jgi:hypothetical protein